MYRIVILPDNRIPDILLIETKPDTGYPAIFYSRIRISGQIIPDIWPDNTGYPAGKYWISGRIIADIWPDTASLLDKAKLARYTIILHSY